METLCPDVANNLLSVMESRHRLRFLWFGDNKLIISDMALGQVLAQGVCEGSPFQVMPMLCLGNTSSNGLVNLINLNYDMLRQVVKDSILVCCPWICSPKSCLAWLIYWESMHQIYCSTY